MVSHGLIECQTIIAMSLHLLLESDAVMYPYICYKYDMNHFSKNWSSVVTHEFVVLTSYSSVLHN